MLLYATSSFLFYCKMERQKKKGKHGAEQWKEQTSNGANIHYDTVHSLNAWHILIDLVLFLNIYRFSVHSFINFTRNGFLSEYALRISSRITIPRINASVKYQILYSCTCIGLAVAFVVIHSSCACWKGIARIAKYPSGSHSICCTDTGVVVVWLWVCIVFSNLHSHRVLGIALSVSMCACYCVPHK